MLFWITCALLTAAVTVMTLRPILSRRPIEPGAMSAEADLRVYKDQLSEVERDVARGLLTGQEAESARLEVSRRILSVDGTDEMAEPKQRSTFAEIVFYLSAAIVVISSLGLYLAYGSPGYRNQPHAARANQPANQASVNELVARVEARLREAPNDGQGWDVLAPVYLKRGRNRDAAQAYRKAIELLGETRKRLRGLAEAVLASTNGIVAPEARMAFEKILAKEPNLIAPRFWLAVGKEQDGDHKGAATAYRALLKTNPQSPPLPPALRQLITERLAVVVGGGAPTSGAKPAPSVKASEAAKPGEGAKSGEGEASAPRAAPEAGKGPPPPSGMTQGMSAKQRAEMIEQMVSGLAERLVENGGTEQEWQRLMRAYNVLGRSEKALAALAQAKTQFAGDAAAVTRLDAFAKALGIETK